MRFVHVFRAALLLAVLAIAGQLPGQAAKNVWDVPGMAPPRLEVVVFEAQDCAYCEIFKRDIAPSYKLAGVSAEAPMRFVDISKSDVDKMGLAARLDLLPTTVLLRDGKEVERITGLTSASTYYALLKHMIAKNDG